jgi:hypothetical protein
MTHYICPAEDNAVSDHAKVCELDSCPLVGHQLVECNCMDGKHTEVKAQYQREQAQAV